MVLNNTNKNNSILLEVFASVFTVSSYFTDNPRIHHFKSESINNMDHMRISGNEPSSVILSQRKTLKKVKNNAKKYHKKLTPTGMV